MAAGGASALAFANRGRGDLPDVSSPNVPPPSVPPASAGSGDAGAVAMPRADGPDDPFANPSANPPANPPANPLAGSPAEPGAPRGDAPIVVTPDTSGPGEAPHVVVPPDPKRSGRGGLWAGLLAVVVLLGGLLLAREPLAEATGVEGRLVIGPFAAKHAIIRRVDPARVRPFLQLGLAVPASGVRAL